MGLSPEEKKRVYEEEKARIEAEGQAAKGTTKLKPNVAGLICYAGFWVTGIVFLIIERKNKLVRFHAMQSLVVFGILNIIWGVANYIRWAAWVYTGNFIFAYAQWVAATVVFAVFFAFWWVLWAVLMYRTYHDRLYKVPAGLGDFAEKMLAKLDSSK